MIRIKRMGVVAALGCMISAAFAPNLWAQSGDGADYPSRAISIVVPAPPGSANDLLARRIAEPLSQRLGQPIVIDNRPGAGAIIGTEFVARAAPDGYTLLSANVVHAINGSIKTRLPYHPLRDFTSISLLGFTPSVLLASPSIGVSSVADLVKAAQAKPGALGYATAGVGTAGHLAGELFTRAANINLLHVPYKGITQGINDILGGHVPLIFLFGLDAVPLARNGSLVPLAVTSTSRSSLLPKTPTFAESGYPSVELSAWYGLLGPAKMPDAVVRRLNDALRAILDDQVFKGQLSDLMFEAQSSSPKELETRMAQDLERFSKITLQAGMRSER